MEINPPEILRRPLLVPNKTLMGAGPSNCPQRVLDAMSNPVLGHLHPECLKIMDEIKEGIKYLFQTQNTATMCISSSGHGGMEAALCNVIEDGDVVLLGTTGHWGTRAADMAKRYGADTRICKARYTEPLTMDEIQEAFNVHKPKVFFIAQGDSSTGILQTHLQEIGELCRKKNCIFIVDVVASLGGTEFYMDEWKVDIAYTASQKVLGASAGLAPISFSQQALNRINNRNSLVKVYYWDVNLVGDYWGCFGRPRIYHHTISSTLLYGLREALAIACGQGLRSLIHRHNQCALRLQRGLEDMGLELFIPNPANRLSTVNTVKIPKGVDSKMVSEYAMKKYFLEIVGGLGPTTGIVFRIGLMGENATFEKVELVLKILKEAIQNTSHLPLSEKSKI